MIFKQIDEIVNGTKTQTRRIVKPGEVLTYINGEGRRNDFPAQCFNSTVLTPAGRLKWQVGRDYAVSPELGKPGVWWIPGTDQWWDDPTGLDDQWHPLRIVITAIRREPMTITGDVWVITFEVGKGDE